MRILPALILLLLLVGAPACVGGEDVPPSGRAAAGSGTAIVEALNAHRQHEGHRPLSPDPALQAVAEEVVAAIEERGTTRNVDLGTSAFVGRVRTRGYVERKLVIGTVEGGTPREVAEQWPEVDPRLWQRFLGPELRDVAVAVGWKGAVPYVLVLAGVTRAQSLAEAGAGLELDAVRSKILDWTNRLRARRGLWELQPNDTLDAAAQRYAEDMIASDFYGHESPGGTTVMERVRSGGYRALHAGENLAQGSADPREVFDGWVESESHRRNLLHPGFRHLGVGMAQGETGDGGYRIVWVQVFGRSR